MKRGMVLFYTCGLVLGIILISTVVGCDEPYAYNVSDVPSYCQLGGNRCGATCAQMLIQFCCEKVSPAYVPSWYTGNLTTNQQYLLHYNTTTGAWSGWLKDYHDANGINSPYKHPDAVNEAIMTLKESAPGNFNVLHNTDRDILMHDVVYWIKTMDYPSATLKSGYHWVLIYGFETDVEPTPSNTITLNKISIIEPSCAGCTDPGIGGIDIPDMSATAWFDDYWDVGAALWPGHAYHNEYIAVVEPPEKHGVVQYEKGYIGTKEEIIAKENIMKKALEYVKSKNLAQYRSLRYMADAQPQEAILVEWPDKKKYYYLVLFSTKETGPVQAVMVLNAYNGNYRECGALCKPLIFLKEKEAISVLLEKAKIKEYKKLDARLTYITSDITQTHYLPFWKITVDEKTFYVDQNRAVHNKLTEMEK